MSTPRTPPRVSLLRQVTEALEEVAQENEHAARQRALMYAEAIDDADEADALLRFGPRLEACLDSLGLTRAVDLPTRRGRRPPESSLAA